MKTTRRNQRALAAALSIAAAACSSDVTRDPTTRLVGITPESPATITAQAVPTLAWANSPGGVAVAVDAVDNTYTARWDYNPAGDIYVAKRDVRGNLLWEVRYDNTDNTRHEVATWVATDRAGNVFVSGTIRSGYSNPVNANSLLMKFAPNGQLLWRKVYAAAFDGSSTRKVLVDGADNAYVFGLGVSPTGLRTTIRKFSPSGAVLWTWFDPAGIGSPLNIKWGADGALLVSARAIYGSVNGFAKVDQNGNTLWTLAGIRSVGVGDVAGDAQGNAYLVNGDYVGGTPGLLRKVAPDASTIWQLSLGLIGQRVEVGKDNNPVISGYPAAGFGAAFTKYDANGNLLWINLDADGPGNSLLAHAQLRLDAFDNAYLAASNMSQMGVAKVLGATGAADWTMLVPFGYAVSLEFGSQQRVFITGGTTALIEQGGAPPPPPPTNTAPTVSIAAVSGTTIPVNGTFDVRATFSDPDVGDGPWTYKWRWSTGSTTGTWTAPGAYVVSRRYPSAGSYRVSVVVTDARGAVGTSNFITVTVR